MKTPIKKRVAQHVAASSLLLLLTAAAAQGAIYSGKFHPEGDGVDFPGFTGTALFTVDDNCIDNGSGFFFTGGSGCGPAFMTSATVNLFDPSDTDPLPDEDRVDFFTLSGLFPLIGVLVDNGEVVGVDTGLMGPAFGAGYLTHWSSTTPFWLQFQSGCLGPEPQSGCFTDPAFIYMGENQIQSAPANDLTFQRVPEPGTLALVLGALGLGGLARRWRGSAAR